MGSILFSDKEIREVVFSARVSYYLHKDLKNSEIYRKAVKKAKEDLSKFTDKELRYMVSRCILNNEDINEIFYKELVGKKMGCSLIFPEILEGKLKLFKEGGVWYIRDKSGCEYRVTSVGEDFEKGTYVVLTESVRAFHIKREDLEGINEYSKEKEVFEVGEGG